MISSKKRASLLCDALSNKKGFDIVCLDVRRLSPITDYLVIASGTSDRHVKAVAESAMEALDEMGERALHVEGMQDGNWVLVDASDIMVHIFKESVREYYDLEGLWNRAKKADLE